MKDFRIGMEAECKHIFCSADVAEFARISGDLNPIHLDDSYAAATRFKRPIVHGMLSASLFSRLFAMSLPGPGAILCEQSINYLRPVYIGEEVTARIILTKIEPKKGIGTFECYCFNSASQQVLSGHALLLLPD